MAVQQGTEFLVLSHTHIGQFSLAGWTKAKHKVGFRREPMQNWVWWCRYLWVQGRRQDKCQCLRFVTNAPRWHLYHADHVLVDRQHVSPFGNIFYQKFAHHLIPQRIPEAFYPCGTGGLFAVGGRAAGDHRLDLYPR